MEEKKRDLKHEYELVKNKKKMYTIRVKHELAEKLDEKLASDGIAFTQFVMDAISKYLGE